MIFLVRDDESETQEEEQIYDLSATRRVDEPAQFFPFSGTS